MSSPTVVTHHFERYDAFEKFAERFHTGVNPVLEWWQRNKGMVDGMVGNYLLILTMHHDEEKPFLVELPWTLAAVEFVHANQVDIQVLPKFE